MKSTTPGPNDSFILRTNGTAKCCEDCGTKLFHKLPPRNGVNADRYGCNRCGAAYLFFGGAEPTLLEN